MARRRFLGCSALLLACGCGAAPPASAPQARTEHPEWMSCASNDDCTLFRIEPGHCCDFGELRGINRRFQAEAEKEWGPTPEELEAARKAELICTDSCMAPPDSAAVCKQGRCAVVYVDASP